MKRLPKPKARWSIHPYRIRNGSKQIGMAFWWNDVRIGFQVNLGVWEIQLIREN